jgi:hypothetical protein
MRSQQPAFALLHLALLLLVLSGVGSIHSHRCLDGQEPAFTVHFENLNGHPEHAVDEAHVDVEQDLTAQALPVKAPDQDSPLFLTALSFLFFCVRLPQRPPHGVQRDNHFHQPPSALLPPLRAPPHHSH